MLAVGSSEAIRSGVSPAQDNDVFSLRRNVAHHVITGLNPIGRGEVFHRVMNSQEVPTRNGQLSWDAGTGSNNDGVVTLAQLLPGDVHPNVDAGPESRPLGLHLGKPLVNMLLFHLEIGNSVAKQSTNTVITIKNGHGVTDSSELLSRCQTRWPTAHYGNSLTRESLRRVRGDIATSPRLVDDGNLNLLDGDRRSIDP